MSDFKDTDGMGFSPAPDAHARFVTLSNGDRVAPDSLAWRDECAQRHRHVMTLRSIGTVVERRSYVATVAHREGSEAGKRLTEAYARDFEQRKAAEAAARKEMAP